MGKTTMIEKAPALLLTAGTGAFALTLYFTAKAVRPALKRLDMAREETEHIRDPRKKALAVAKRMLPVVAPAGLSAAATLACFYGATRMEARKSAAFAGLYSSAGAFISKYQEKVVEKIGEDAEKAIFSETSDETASLDAPEITMVNDLIEGDGPVLVYDRVTGRYFKSSTEEIRNAESAIVKRLVDEVRVPLNDFYAELGLDDVSYIGDAVGWELGGPVLDVAFRSGLYREKTPCLVLTYQTTVINRGALM